MMELKPCPFCGREVEWNSGCIECRYCNVKMIGIGGKELTEERWNKRATKATEIEVVQGDLVIQKGLNNKHIINNGTMTMTFGK